MTTLEHYGTKGMKSRSINNQADARMVKSKRNVRRLKSVGALAGSAASLYLSTPEGRDKLATAAKKVKAAYKR